MSENILIAIIAGILPLIGVLLTNYINSKSKNIIQERREWREKIRKISVELSTLDIENMTEELKYTRLYPLLTALKVRLNPYGENAKSYFWDSHIWESIKNLEQSDSRTNSEKEKLITYLSLLLKFDWERSKKETAFNALEIISYCLYIFSNVIVVYLCYTHTGNLEETKILISQIIALLVSLALLFFAPVFVTFIFKLLHVPTSIQNTVFHCVLIIVWFISLWKNKGILEIALLPLSILLIASGLLLLSHIAEILDHHQYKREIKKVDTNNKNETHFSPLKPTVI